MATRKGETCSRIIEELGPISASCGRYVTIRMSRWHYYIDRGKLTIVEGIHGGEELEKVIDKCGHADADVEAGLSPPADCPRHFTVVCRPIDLVHLAKDILNLYKGYEDMPYWYRPDEVQNEKNSG